MTSKRLHDDSPFPKMFLTLHSHFSPYLWLPVLVAVGPLSLFLVTYNVSTIPSLVVTPSTFAPSRFTATIL